MKLNNVIMMNKFILNEEVVHGLFTFIQQV